MGSINEIVLFETDDKEVTLSVPMEGELEKDTSVEIFDRSTNNASRPPKYNNLDVIISVGYHG